MSRSYYQSFVPSLHFPSPSPINSFTIPRSYNHSSDESETGGGGGGSPASHGDSHRVAQDQIVTDAPFIPRRDNPPANARAPRDLTLLPESRNFEYIYGADQTSPPTTTYGGRSSAYAPQSRHGHVVYARDSARHFSYHQDDDRPQWPNVSPDPSDHLYHPELADPYPTDQDVLPNQPDITRHTQSRFPRHSRTYPEPSGPSRFSGYSRRLVSSGRNSPSSSSEYSIDIKHSPNSTPISLSPSALQASEVFIEEWLRSVTGIPEGMPVNLWSLPDPPQNQKPSLVQKYLSALAIWGSERKRLTLKAIYAAIIERFPVFDSNDRSWQGSIRHSLSLHNIFRHIPRDISEPGKGGYWELDISKGEGYKRERRRRKRTQDSGMTVGDYEMSEESEGSSPGPGDTSSQEPSSDSSRSRTPKLTAPYPVRPSASQPSTSGLRQMSISPTPPSSQAVFGQSSHHLSSRQPAFGQPSLGTGSLNRAQSQPNFATQPGVSRPHSRAATVPAPGTYAPMAPLRQLLGMPIVHFQLPNRQGTESEGTPGGNTSMQEEDEDHERVPNTPRDRKGKGRAH